MWDVHGVIWNGMTSVKVLVYKSFISMLVLTLTSQTVLLNTSCHYPSVCWTVISKCYFCAWLYKRSHQHISDVLFPHLVTQGLLLVWIHKAMGTLISAGCLFMTP